jgi:hypothetical protein
VVSTQSTTRYRKRVFFFFFFFFFYFLKIYYGMQIFVLIIKGIFISIYNK